MAPKLYALILAGGSGTRLWPRSQPHMPKQFLDFTGAGSLLQLAQQRLHPFIPAARTFVATHTDYRVLAHQQLRTVPAGNILGEPAARGTAAAIGLAALHIRRRDPQGVMAVLTADHLITKKREFQAALRTAAQLAADGWLVTLGIAPSRAETGYGYIQRGAALPARGAQRAYRVARFVEKPARDTAAKYAASGAYSWNSGMFIWRAERVLEEMALHMPELHAGLEQIGAALGQAHAARTLAKIWPLLPVETIDYGVMEKAARVAVLPVEIGWSDVGSWDVLYNLLPHDAHGNAVSGQHYSPDTRNSLIYSGHRIVATLGLQDMVVVDTPTALLICPRERAQEVKLLAQMATHKRTADKPKKKTAKPAARKPALRAKTKPRKRA